MANTRLSCDVSTGMVVYSRKFPNCGSMTIHRENLAALVRDMRGSLGLFDGVPFEVEPGLPFIDFKNSMKEPYDYMPLPHILVDAVRERLGQKRPDYLGF